MTEDPAREETATTSHFTDPAVGIENLVRSLDRQTATPESAPRYRIKYELLALRPGEAVLDIGCGAGSDLFRIADAVEPSGRAVGVDVNPAMVEVVRERASAAGLTQVEAQLIEDGPLPFADGTFDAVHTERVLMHVADPDLLVQEMVRVLKPAGRLVCCENDFGTRNLLDLDDMELFERVYGAQGAGTRNQYMGRQLYRRLVRAGLHDVSATTVPRQYSGHPSPEGAEAREFQLASDLRLLIERGRITEEEAARFRTLIQARLDAGEYFEVTLYMLARGVKPA